MKQFTAILLLLVVAGCQAEFDPADRLAKPTPVVYCILNLNDSVQSVRLSGTFVPKTNELAHPPYNPNNWKEETEIYLEEISPKEEPVIYYFQETEPQVNQDSGLFQSPSFTMYQAFLRPKPETLYRLYVFLKETGTHCFSETTTVGIPVIVDPARIPGRELSFSAYDDYLVHFYTPANSAFQVASFAFGEWNFFRNYYGSTQEGGRFLAFSSERFFAELNQHADFSSPEFSLTCYGEEVALYNQVFAGSPDIFTPLNFNSITNGAGLFSSSIQVKVSNLTVSNRTLELIDQDFDLSGRSFIDYENSAYYGQLSFHFVLPPSVLPTGKVHRTELKLAYTADSLYRGLFFAEANVTDTREEYNFTLPEGDYYYQAGITCSCLSDSCLWDGFPNGQYGRRYSINQISVTAGQSIDEKPLFQ